MRAKQIAVRAALVCGSAGIVCALWSVLDTTPAHATDREPGPVPAAVELAGDLVDIPGHTVEQVPHPVTKLARAAGWTPKPVEHVQESVEQIRATVADAVQPLTKTPPLPGAAPKRAAPPASDAPDAVPAVVLLSGAAPSTVTIDPTQADAIAPAAAQALSCGDDTGEANPPHPERTAAPSEAPCTPDSRRTTGLAQVQPPTKTSVDQLAATAPSGPAAPALLLLGKLLPRSGLPTGRTTPPEPGPA